MLPAIKVWKMDYSFIIKNYLNPALWQKTWTLFEYKDFVITIKLTKIETENMRIVFRLNLRDNSRPNTWGDQEDVSYSLKGSSIKFLIKNIKRLRSAYEYHLLTDFYLVFAESIGDDAKYQTVMDKLEENEIENVLKEINQYKTYIETDDYQEEMKGLLEEI